MWTSKPFAPLLARSRPNPGGVGPMTIALLMQNTVRAAGDGGEKLDTMIFPAHLTPELAVAQFFSLSQERVGVRAAIIPKPGSPKISRQNDPCNLLTDAASCPICNARSSAKESARNPTANFFLIGVINYLQVPQLAGHGVAAIAVQSFGYGRRGQSSPRPLPASSRPTRLPSSARPKSNSHSKDAADARQPAITCFGSELNSRTRRLIISRCWWTM